SEKSDAQIVYTDVNPDYTLSGTDQYLLDLNNDGTYDFRINQFNITDESCPDGASAYFEAYGNNSCVVLNSTFTFYVFPFDNSFEIGNNNSAVNSAGINTPLDWDSGGPLWAFQYIIGSSSAGSCLLKKSRSWQGEFIGLKLISNSQTYY